MRKFTHLIVPTLSIDGRSHHLLNDTPIQLLRTKKHIQFFIRKREEMHAEVASRIADSNTFRLYPAP
ncbi:hypothetical protein KTT_33620 [Tengunoibacter tsumagoiensis]|uniref:Uncharacterized protein n=1 Tax=Tengunoibacter tsumagoiensis TaxID=2014871 RepID=A0A402A2X8_9CHLR|nr:hypothetical protein KTT_33620 [Tengunoibacter tsumagoiensis]